MRMVFAASASTARGSAQWSPMGAIPGRSMIMSAWPQPIHSAGGQASTIASSRKRSEEHTSELQSLMRISYAVFCLKKKNKQSNKLTDINTHIFYKPHTLDTTTYNI